MRHRAVGFAASILLVAVTALSSGIQAQPLA